MLDHTIALQTQILLDCCSKRELTIATAESCTGGRVASAITAIAGSSSAYCGGIIAYNNTAKLNLLDVNSITLANHGAVSAEIAKEMAQGARARLNADIALASTGIAGPSGASKTKPVGLVYLAAVFGSDIWCERHEFRPRQRNIVQRLAVFALLSLANKALKTNHTPHHSATL